MNYVIIGNSTAAIGCIEGIRKVDLVSKITVISDEPYFTYGRPLISYWLGGKVSDTRMHYRPLDFYEKNNCELLLGETVTAINPDTHQVLLASGQSTTYDKLLIATGSRPFVPPMSGLDSVKNCFNFMTYDDAKNLKKVLTPTSKVLIIGAGLIGLKAAEGIYETTQDITVVDLAPRILPSILDETGSHIVQSFLEEKGITFYLKDSVSQFTERTATLNSGVSLNFDILIVAVGVKPNVELAQEAGISINRGILTTPTCQTSKEDIYAAGDCCESFDLSIKASRILAILPNAYRQGEVAGMNMAGSYCTFNQAIPMNAIGFFGLHMMTAGSDEGESFITQTATGYKKFITKDGVLKGFILIGDVLKRAGIYTTLIKEEIPLTTVDFELLKEAPQMMAFSKLRRQEKLGGLKANLGGMTDGN